MDYCLGISCVAFVVEFIDLIVPFVFNMLNYSKIMIGSG